MMAKPPLRDRIDKEIPPSSFLPSVGPLLFLVGIFFINFLSRIILSPLMPTVERDLRIGHDEAGGIFFVITFGYCMGLLFSGFISSRLTHRGAILLSAFAVGAALIWVGLTPHLWGIRIGLMTMGLAAGFYLPSGIATLTNLVSQRHWGKAIAIHELAPNLGFVVAPMLAEVLLVWFSWQAILIFIGLASWVMGFVFAFRGKGGHIQGTAPDLRTLKSILKESSFLLMVVFFSLGVGSSFSVYSMVPLYLVAEKGIDRTWANTLLAISRIAPLATAFVAGWMTDRLGIKKTLQIVFLTSGVATAMIGLVPASWIPLVIFIQPILATAFFPAGFAALSRIGSPRIKNLAVSLTVPLGFLIGGGAGTAALGLAGEARFFNLGFIFFGGIIGGGSLLVSSLKLDNESSTL